MLTVQDFGKKQIIFVLCNEGEKIAFSNDNIVVKTNDNNIKFQCTCYRLFIVFVIGSTSITTVLIQKAKKFGFFIALMTAGFRLNAIIGAPKDGNTVLKRKQYNYNDLGIAKTIVQNKILNQMRVLKYVRSKNDSIKSSIPILADYAEKTRAVSELQELLAYEGLASKLYFRNHFNNVLWQGRQPRIKKDFVNSTLDIGYTLLFAYIDALLESFGFDTYCGVLHRQFYMRKSLVCDLVEPFRILIDCTVKKAINLKQIKEEDFTLVQNQYRLNWKHSSQYVKVLMTPIIENKENIFSYVQSYYRAFMKDRDPDNFPIYEWGKSSDNYQL